MNNIKTQTEWEVEMSVKILKYIRNEIYLDFRYLDVALSVLEWSDNENVTTFATDGRILYYQREQLIRVFKSNVTFLNRSYLHSVLHCIYSHLWTRNHRDKRIWNIACDIAVEYTIDKLMGGNKNSVKRALSFIRGDIYEQIISRHRVISAATAYKCIENMNEHIDTLAKEFYTDSHMYWPDEEDTSASNSNTAKQWDKISRQTSMEMESRGDENEDGEQSVIRQIRSERDKRSYKDFLRKFMVLHEEMTCDPDEFDLNYYTYGLSVYGNMPLIEPLESRETMKIKDFVIIVDTSYSTSGDLIKKFLKSTFGILSEKENFFRKCNIRIIQCDDRIQRDEKVTDIADIDNIIERFEVTGEGGTDFRPAFTYVNELIDNRELTDLKGVLYFTDGKGIFPAKRPKYKCAFVFTDNNEDVEVPPWAMKVKFEL